MNLCIKVDIDMLDIYRYFMLIRIGFVCGWMLCYWSMEENTFGVEHFYVDVWTNIDDERSVNNHIIHKCHKTSICCIGWWCLLKQRVCFQELKEILQESKHV